MAHNGCASLVHTVYILYAVSTTLEYGTCLWPKAIISLMCGLSCPDSTGSSGLLNNYPADLAHDSSTGSHFHQQQQQIRHFINTLWLCRGGLWGKTDSRVWMQAVKNYKNNFHIWNAHMLFIWFLIWIQWMLVFYLIKESAIFPWSIHFYKTQCSRKYWWHGSGRKKKTLWLGGRVQDQEDDREL